ncbi:transmembrane emp24 domain-containing protein p24delta3-like [Salvia miltiorrhiza]|uniref:transmembrane emp24 domain-containing protein p24delta3-like n=1 Tax=Salvia miltiorrhiza TaxID=226208 RepID=UPI0025AD49BA|nr:transmembrane emp24 domain-containing protein p24delta3-like [Salvia miltiorrhiza]
MKLVVEARRLWAVMLAVAAALPAARGVWLKMPSSGRKCVYEELQSNVVVIGDYYSFYGDGDANYTTHPTLTVKVSSPFGNKLYEKEGARHGQFALTTNEPGNYKACFVVDSGDQSGKPVTVGLEWRTGIATKDWDSVAKKEKIEGLDLEMKKLQDYVQAIKDKMIQLMSKELKMRSVITRTNTRVAQYSQASLGVCILVSALQLWYLRRYFHHKKLI